MSIFRFDKFDFDGILVFSYTSSFFVPKPQLVTLLFFVFCHEPYCSRVTQTKLCTPGSHQWAVQLEGRLWGTTQHSFVDNQHRNRLSCVSFVLLRQAHCEHMHVTPLWLVPQCEACPSFVFHLNEWMNEKFLWSFHLWVWRTSFSSIISEIWNMYSARIPIEGALNMKENKLFKHLKGEKEQNSFRQPTQHVVLWQQIVQSVLPRIEIQS